MNGRVMGAIFAAFASGVSFGLAAGWRKEVVNNATTIIEYRDLPRAREEVPTEVLLPMTVVELRDNLSVDLSQYEEVAGIYTMGDYIFISEQSWHEDDEYDKITLELFRDDLQYQLVVDGDTVMNWQEILTEDIIEELKGKAGFFIRNEGKKADYEVTWGKP